MTRLHLGVRDLTPSPTVNICVKLDLKLTTHSGKKENPNLRTDNILKHFNPPFYKIQGDPKKVTKHLVLVMNILDKWLIILPGNS